MSLILDEHSFSFQISSENERPVLPSRWSRDGSALYTWQLRRGTGTRALSPSPPQCSRNSPVSGKEKEAIHNITERGDMDRQHLKGAGVLITAVFRKLSSIIQNYMLYVIKTCYITDKSSLIYSLKNYGRLCTVFTWHANMHPNAHKYTRDRDANLQQQKKVFLEGKNRIFWQKKVFFENSLTLTITSL